MPRATITFFFAFSAPSAFLQRPLREQTKRWHFILKSSADQETIFAVTSKISPAKDHHCNNCAKNNDDQRRQVNSSFTITAIHTALLLPICLSLKDVKQELVAKIVTKPPSLFLKITRQEICGLRKSDG